ncbi:MAG: DUF4960 domain-containing protein [Dysgonomonas sp.]
MKNIISILITLFLISGSISAVEPVTNMTAQRAANDIVVNWSLPQNATISSVEISYNGISQELSATANSYKILNTPDDKEYTIIVKTKNGNEASLETKAIINSLRYAFVTTYNSASEIEDDDEIAAANWFLNKYPNNGDILSTSNITTTDLSEYKTIWLHIDRVGDGKIPAGLLNADVINKLKSYYQGGGNMFFSVHATQYLANLGRIPENRKPGILGAGNGGNNTDIWSFNVNIGMVYDYSSHPLYVGLPTIPDFGHPTIPLIGSGYKEDHNSMWDLNSYGYTPAEGSNVVLSFEDENNATVMGTWGHVTDFCCAGIVDFNPTASYKGRSIAIGLAAYEWNQNSGENIYQDCIETLTKNVFDYLKTEVVKGEQQLPLSIESKIYKEGLKFIIADNQIQFLNFEKASKVYIYTMTGKAVLNDVDCNKIDISSLSSGVYLISYTTKDGMEKTGKFIK